MAVSQHSPTADSLGALSFSRPLMLWAREFIAWWLTEGLITAFLDSTSTPGSPPPSPGNHGCVGPTSTLETWKSA